MEHRKIIPVNEWENFHLISKENANTPEPLIKSVKPTVEISSEIEEDDLYEWDRLNEENLYFRHTLEAMTKLIWEEFKIEMEKEK